MFNKSILSCYYTILIGDSDSDINMSKFILYYSALGNFMNEGKGTISRNAKFLI